MIGTLDEYVPVMRTPSSTESVWTASGLSVGGEVVIVDGLHEETTELVAIKSPATKEEATELAHTFDDTRERINDGGAHGRKTEGTMTTKASARHPCTRKGSTPAATR